MTVFGGMIAVSFIGSIMVPAFFVAVNTMKEWTAKGGLKDILMKLFGKAKEISVKAGKKIADEVKKNSKKGNNEKND